MLLKAKRKQVYKLKKIKQAGVKYFFVGLYLEILISCVCL